jgi:hypothetical protein
VGNTSLKHESGVLKKEKTKCLKKMPAQRARGVARVVEHLPGKSKAPSSNTSTAKCSIFEGF